MSQQPADWVRCPSCAAFVYRKRLRRSLGVCPECNHHFRVGLHERLAQLLDPDSFEPGAEVESLDPLGFADSKPYAARLAEAQARTGLRSGAVHGTGAIGGLALAVAGIEFGFIGGSMSGAVGETIARAADLALERRIPLLAISASGGARMQEGCVSLMQMAKTGQAIGLLRAAGVPFISLMTDPTYGGVTASFATLGDVLVTEPGAHVGFAGPSVIEQTIRERLPAGFQTAEFLLKCGMVDLVVAREDLRGALQRLLEVFAAAATAAREPDRGSGRLPERRAAARAPETDSDAIAVRDAWEVVQSARRPARPRAQTLIANVFDGFDELHGDRLFRDDPSIIGGLAWLGELPVVVIGHAKGETTQEMMARNFGMPHPEGYRKAMRLMTLAERFGLPVITLIDTAGAYPGIGAEERGQSQAIAESILQMSALRVPTIAVVCGEGGSGGALALAAADRVLLLEQAYYSVISPEGCATILFKDAAAAPRAAAALRLTPHDLLELGIADAVVPEAEDDVPGTVGASLRLALSQGLSDLLAVDASTRVANRLTRFRSYGVPGEQTILTPIGGPT